MSNGRRCSTEEGEEENWRFLFVAQATDGGGACSRYSVVEEKTVDFMERNLARKRHRIWGLRGSSDVKDDLKVFG